MKFLIPTRMAAVCVTVALGGCVVAPVGMEPAYGGQGQGGPGYGAPPVAVYVAPTYVMPGPGYAWQFHVRHGWGWHHQRRGWHRGWR